MSLELEMSVIGGLLLSENATHMEGVFNKIAPDCFTTNETTALYSELKRQYSERFKLDLVITLERLGDGFKELVVASMECVPATQTLPYYADMLFESYRKQLLTTALYETLNNSTSASVGDTVASLQQALLVQSELDKVSASTSMDFLASIIEYVTNLNDKGSTCYKTGIKLLDYLLSGGFKPKEVSIISGRSGMGKSDIAIYLALSLAIKGTKVLYLSMEMPRVQIMNRITSRITKIDSTTLSQKNLISSDQMIAVMTSLEKFTRLPITLDEQQNLSVQDVSAKIAKHKPSVVIIDHIGLMKQNKYKSQWESTFETSKALKQLAMSEDVSIIELVQQNREVEGRKDKLGKLSDLKGTDGLGNDADNVFFIHAQKDDENQVLSGTDSLEVTLQLIKNRSGKTGVVKLRWSPQYHSYSQLTINK